MCAFKMERDDGVGWVACGNSSVECATEVPRGVAMSVCIVTSFNRTACELDDRRAYGYKTTQL